MILDLFTARIADTRQPIRFIILFCSSQSTHRERNFTLSVTSSKSAIRELLSLAISMIVRVLLDDLPSKVPSASLTPALAHYIPLPR